MLADTQEKVQSLLQSLLDLGMLATDVRPEVTEGSPQFPKQPAGLVGARVQNSVALMQEIQASSRDLNDIPVPVAVLNLIDAGRNPHTFTRDTVDRLEGENMFSNGALEGLDMLAASLDKEINKDASVP